MAQYNYTGHMQDVEDEIVVKCVRGEKVMVESEGVVGGCEGCTLIITPLPPSLSLLQFIPSPSQCSL